MAATVLRRKPQVAFALILLALLARILVPAGWMPAAGQGFSIMLCTSAGVRAAWVDGSGKVHEQAPTAPQADHPCLFAAAASALDVPAVTEMGVLAPLATTLLALSFVPGIGRGLAAPPPPPTGPPSTR